VIEEAPAPGMDAETREAVCGAAVRAAKAVNYENAGTIEFIADASEGLRGDRIWFMEMNTRLQVEHPVTEEITGQDLIEWQLRVASSEKLPKKQDELSINGHAIEARLYAEDPSRGFLPSVGKLEHFNLPPTHALSEHSDCDEFDLIKSPLRIDSGVEQGDEISPFYDPMIAKLIAHASSRSEAIDELALRVAHAGVWPVKTNATFVRAALLTDEFGSAQIDTGLIARREAELTARPQQPDRAELERVVSFLAWQVTRGGQRPSIPLTGWRLNASSAHQLLVSLNGIPRYVDIQPFGGGTGWTIYAPGSNRSLTRAFLTEQGTTFVIEAHEPRGTGASHGLHDGEIEAPMPGKVTAIEISKGEKVAKGQRLLTLEAMKMEHALTAPFDGTVTELNAKAGAQVTEGQLLVKVEASEQ
jgi:3-methylcrotonyl-CoA carboxylase alpha subunit